MEQCILHNHDLFKKDLFKKVVVKCDQILKNQCLCHRQNYTIHWVAVTEAMHLLNYFTLFLIIQGIENITVKL